MFVMAKTAMRSWLNLIAKPWQPNISGIQLKDFRKWCLITYQSLKRHSGEVMVKTIWQRRYRMLSFLLSYKKVLNMSR